MQKIFAKTVSSAWADSKPAVAQPLEIDYIPGQNSKKSDSPSGVAERSALFISLQTHRLLSVTHTYLDIKSHTYFRGPAITEFPKHASFGERYLSAALLSLSSHDIASFARQIYPLYYFFDESSLARARCTIHIYVYTSAAYSQHPAPEFLAVAYI